ncbi:MAG: DUF4336 domain-containing protein [Cyanobacteria bacterium P01_F01_bin.150]
MASITPKPQAGDSSKVVTLNQDSLKHKHNTYSTEDNQRSWPLWPLVPIYPYGNRQTLCTEVIPGKIWTFDQLQGIFYVVVPIRMTVVKLSSGGLLVYAPVAPTKECIEQMRQITAVHGDVKYIILPTVSGLEHKVFVGPFARQFPEAQVYVAPDQWSFPINLPLSWLGLPMGRTHKLPKDDREMPFSEDFDYIQLGPIELGVGPFEEIVFFHRESRCLILTDAVLSMPAQPPAVLEREPYPMLFHARETGMEPIEDTPANRLKGWKRIALFSMYFQPNALGNPRWGQVFREAFKGSDRSQKGYFGIYPFNWRDDWETSFNKLHGNGRLFVAPILQQLIFNRDPETVLAWRDRVCQWDFQQIIPCHLHGPIAATPDALHRAFSFLETGTTQEAVPGGQQGGLPVEDFFTIKQIDKRLNRLRITQPSKC